MYVLEAVVTVSIMVSAVTFVVVTKVPLPSDNVVYNEHQARLNNWARLIENFPLPAGS